MTNQSEDRGQWSSRIGFILAASGSAIGLGSIWRFPYITGQNGGAAFVLLYIFFLFVIAIPYMLCEFALGRSSKKNPIGAIENTNPRSIWLIGGILSVLIPIIIGGYYTVIAGWSFGYIFKMLIGKSAGFSQFASSPQIVFPLFIIFLLFNALVVHKGVEKGIERWTKLLMPTLLVIMVILLIRSLTLEGAAKGLEFYLKPDFSKINATVVVAALGQAFFSLSLGMGVMITYSSYLSKKDNMISSGGFIVAFTTMIAIAMGFIIFPALFAFGEDPASGPALVFIILPELFSKMPFGNMLGASFFFLICIAAFTTIISFIEVPVSYLCDERGWTRKRAVWTTMALISIVGFPCVLSEGAVKGLSSISFFGNKSFIDLMDYAWGSIGISVCCLALCLFVGWVWGADNAERELAKGSNFFKKRFLGLPITMGQIWKIFIKFILPLAIILILLDSIHTR